jgi:Ni/Co efflux regulator RcnB
MKKLFSTLILSASLLLPMTSAQVARAEKRTLNACGCSGEGDSCICERKAKCGCPGECEPKGCEAERQKQLQKEIDAETKRAMEQEKAQNKPKEQAKSDDDSDSAATDKGGKKSAVRPMNASQKKQFLKLLEAYLAEHPEAANKMLSEVRSEL